MDAWFLDCEEPRHQTRSLKNKQNSQQIGPSEELTFGRMLTFESDLPAEAEETKVICRDKLSHQDDISNITTSPVLHVTLLPFSPSARLHCPKEPRLWLVFKEKLPLLKLR